MNDRKEMMAVEMVITSLSLSLSLSPVLLREGNLCRCGGPVPTPDPNFLRISNAVQHLSSFPHRIWNGWV